MVDGEVHVVIIEVETLIPNAFRELGLNEGA